MGITLQSKKEVKAELQSKHTPHTCKTQTLDPYLKCWLYLGAATVLSKKRNFIVIERKLDYCVLEGQLELKLTSSLVIKV